MARMPDRSRPSPSGLEQLAPMVHSVNDLVQGDENSIDKRLGCLISRFDRAARGVCAIKGRTVRVAFDRPRCRRESGGSALAIDIVDQCSNPFAAKRLNCVCYLFVPEETADVVEVTTVLEECVTVEPSGNSTDRSMLAARSTSVTQKSFST